MSEDREALEPRSILAREMAYALYGWTDEEFCHDEDVEDEFDRLAFLQLADAALASTTLAAHVDAAVAEARGEVERLRMSLRHQEVLTASIQEMLPPCHCDMNPETTDGPSEDCARHGRPYSYWVERGDSVAAERDAARADRDRLVEAVRGLADEWAGRFGFMAASRDLRALIADTDAQGVDGVTG